MAKGGKKNGKENEKNIWRKKKFGPQRRERTKKEKEENIWRREIFGEGRIERTEKENEESIWIRKIFGRRTLKPKNPKILSARLSRAELSVVKGKFYIKSKST